MSWKGSGYPKTTYYRRLQRARELGCELSEVPDGRGRHGNHVRGERHPRYGLGPPHCRERRKR